MAAGAMIGKLEQGAAPHDSGDRLLQRRAGPATAARLTPRRTRRNSTSSNSGAESDFGAGRIYALPRRRGAGSATGDRSDRRIAGAAGDRRRRSRRGATPVRTSGPSPGAGHARAELAQDGTDYFDWHHTANDTLDKIDAKAMDQQAAAYAVLAYLAADKPRRFRPFAAGGKRIEAVVPARRGPSDFAW